MRRDGQPTFASAAKVLGNHAERVRRLEFRKPGDPAAVGAAIYLGTPAQTIPSSADEFGSNTAIEHNFTIYDMDSMVDLGTHPERITATRAGIYIATASAVWDIHTDTTFRYAAIFSTGAVIGGSADLRANISGHVINQPLASLVVLQPGEYVWLGVIQGAGSDRDIGAAHLALERLGRAPAL